MALWVFGVILFVIARGDAMEKAKACDIAVVETASGSVYEIDLSARALRRTKTGGPKGRRQHEEGKWFEYNTVIVPSCMGDSLAIFWPDGRRTITGPSVKLSYKEAENG